MRAQVQCPQNQEWWCLDMTKTLRKVKKAGSLQVQLIFDDGNGKKWSAWSDVLNITAFEQSAQNATWAQIESKLNQSYDTIIKSD